jgi:hypothetical protein
MPPVPEQVDESMPEQPPRPAVPGVVLAAVILLYVGGGLIVLSGLIGGSWHTLGEQLTNGIAVGFGALDIVLGYHLYKGRRWAWITVLVLCGIGVALGIVRVVGGGSRAIQTLVWPVVYAALLNTPSARAWFAATRSTPESSG